MFSQKERVNRTTFATVLKGGRVIHSDHVSLRYMAIKDVAASSDNQYTFVVSGKVAKLAVTRNLLKRRGRYIINKIKNNIKKPFIYIFFFKAGADKLDFTGLENELLDLLSRAKLI